MAAAVRPPSAGAGQNGGGSTAAPSPPGVPESEPPSSSVPNHLLRRNLVLLNLYCFLLGLAFLSPLWVVHVRAALAERATWTSWVLASQAAACCAMELPTGVLADLCGRKHCLLASVLVRLVGVSILATLEARIDSWEPGERLVAFIVIAVLEGAAQALASGADVALLHDSLTAMGLACEFPARLATRSVMWPTAAALANLIGAPIAATYGIQSCVAATGLATLLTLPVAGALHEVYPRAYCPNRVRRQIWRKLTEQRQEQYRADDRQLHLNNCVECRNVNETYAPHSHSTCDLQSKGTLSVPATHDLRSRQRLPLTLVQSVDVAKPPEAEQLSLTRQCHSRSRSPSRSRSSSDGQCATMPLTPMGSPMPCSPFAGLPPPSVPDFLSLLRLHLVACVKTLRSAPALPWLIAWGALCHGASEPVHRVRSVFLLAHGLSPVRLGLMGAAGFGLSAVGSLLSARVSRAARRMHVGDGGVILACSVLPPLLQWLASSLNPSADSNGWLAASLLLPGSLLFGVRAPRMGQLLHALTASNQRATVASLQSLANKMALCVCLTCIVGPLIDAHGVDVTVRVLSVLALLPVLPLMRFVAQIKQE